MTLSGCIRGDVDAALFVAGLDATGVMKEHRDAFSGQVLRHVAAYINLNLMNLDMCCSSVMKPRHCDMYALNRP